MVAVLPECRKHRKHDTCIQDVGSIAAQHCINIDPRSRFIVCYQVWRHWTCSFVCHLNSTDHTVLQSFRCIELIVHIAIYGYSFTPESSEACEGKVPYPRTQHRNNVPMLRGEKHDISLQILHRAGFETPRQTATLAKLHLLTIAPRLSKFTEALDICTAYHSVATTAFTVLLFSLIMWYCGSFPPMLYTPDRWQLCPLPRPSLANSSTSAGNSHHLVLPPDLDCVTIMAHTQAYGGLIVHFIAIYPGWYLVNHYYWFNQIMLWCLIFLWSSH